MLLNVLTLVLYAHMTFFVAYMHTSQIEISTSFLPKYARTTHQAAIGAFLAHLGLQTAEGIGVVVSDVATAVTLGACPEDRRTPIVAYDDECANDGICVFSDAYTCDVLGGVMTSATTWVGLMGMMIIAITLAYK